MAACCGCAAVAFRRVGDLFVTLRVVLPDASAPKARELYEAMARELAFDPRRDWSERHEGANDMREQTT